MVDVAAYEYYDPRDNPDNARLPFANRPETILGVTITFMSLATIAIGLRLWARVRDRLWGWDDAMLCMAITASCIGDIFVCMMPKDGMGLHFWTLHDIHLVSYFKHVYTTNIMYCFSATFIKLAILFQYLRLFSETTVSTNSTPYRLARRIAISMIFITAMWGLAFSLLAIFPCKPVSKNWNIYEHGKCIGWGSKDPRVFPTMFIGHSATNMVLDVIVLLLPIPFLKTLRVVGKSKTGLITLFALGALSVSFSIARLILLVMSHAGTRPTIDMSYHTPLIYVFSVLEVNMAILCASIPIFWPVITSLALDKILVVNEVIIRVEDNQRSSFSSTQGIKLTHAEQWPKTSSGKNVHGGIVHGARSKGLNALPRVMSTKFDRSSFPKVFHRSHNRLSSNRPDHRHTRSISTSLGRTMGVNTEISRNSLDSLRNLSGTSDGKSDWKGPLTPSSTYDWFMELDQQQRMITTTTIEKG